jgi:transcriptional regulator with XRE-family HTH domain
VKRYSYSERDYAFGQLMLTLRTSIGLTQAGLADLLGVSRRAVAEWEAGSSYPKAEHLKQLVAWSLSICFSRIDTLIPQWLPTRATTPFEPQSHL